MARGVEWCNKHISSEHPRFSFVLADVYNGEYNPRGRLPACEYKFPFPDNSFDVVLAISVFTNMRSEDVAHYVSEISRVLRAGGRFISTYFLLNRESLALMETGASTFRFRHRMGPCQVVTPRAPELGIAHDESHILQVYDRCGLEVVGPIIYGGWCGRPPVWSTVADSGDQDILLARKPESGVGIPRPYEV